MKRPILLIGGGGHCRSCIDVIETTGRYTIAGIVDLPKRRGEKVLEYRVVGSDDDLPSLVAEYTTVLMTLGHLGDPSRRMALMERVQELGADLPVIVSPTAHVSAHATIGRGTIVMHHAVVNAGASIGSGGIVNTGALVEHDARVGDHCHISTHAVLNGGTTVGKGVFVGSGAVLRHGVRIAPGCLVGAGSVVVRDLEEPGTYVGCPARRIR